MLLELTPQMRSACGRLVEIARANGVLVSFDPNIRRELVNDDAARARLLDAVRSADVVEPTLEEGRIVTGKHSIGDVLRALHAMGPRTVVLTRDKDGAVISRDGRVAIAAGIDEPPSTPRARATRSRRRCASDCARRWSWSASRASATARARSSSATRAPIGMALPTRAQVEELMASGACPRHDGAARGHALIPY